MMRRQTTTKRNQATLEDLAGGLSERQIDSLMFQPWFVPRETFITISQLLPREWALRMHDYYDRFGCLYCRTKIRPYGSNGMCRTCVCVISCRIRRCWKRRLKNLNKEAETGEFRRILVNAKTARDLLQDLITEQPIKRVKRADTPQSNPVNDLMGIAPRTQLSRLKQI
jgi:hypothetical protein